MKVLILCTGNSCRSQIAQGFLQSFDKALEVYSAGTRPAMRVSSKTVKVMQESGIDISDYYPKSVREFIGQEWDYVITVCDHANETCPIFIGKVKHRLHFGFEDPAMAIGDDEYVISIYRSIRDEIKKTFYNLYIEQIKPQML